MPRDEVLSGVGKLSRRRMLLSTATGIAAGLIPPSYARAQVSLADMDNAVAEQAARLADGKPAQLRLLLPEGCQDNVNPVISAFTEKTGIVVDSIVTAVDDINTKLILDQMTGNAGYDLALPATFGIPELAEARALQDLSKFASIYEPTELRRSSMYAIGDRYDGRLYGFQADGDAYLMFYNKPWLEDTDAQQRYADRYGHPLSVPETWQELDQQMAFFHEPDKNRFGGALFRTPTYVGWEWWIRYHAKGVWPFDKDMNPLIDGAEGVLALEELVAASQSLYPKASSAGLFDNWKAYAKGNIYCNIGWGGTQKHLNGSHSKVRGKLAFSVVPGGLIDGLMLTTPYFNWGWNYVVTSQSEKPELAYLFALFASSPKQSTHSVSSRKGYFDPHRPEHYRDERIIEAYSKPFLIPHKASMRGAIPDLYLNGHSEYFGALNDGIIAVLEGRKDAATAMSETAKRWIVITDRLGLNRQRTQWHALRAKYPPAIADRLKPKIS